MAEDAYAEPDEPGRPSGRARTPLTVWAAVVLMAVVVLLQAMVVLIFLLEGQDAVRANAVEGNPFRRDGSTSDGDAAVVGGVIPFIVFAGLFVLLAVKLVRGRNWARLVIIGIAALLALGGLMSGADGDARVIPRVGTAVCVLLVVLLLSGPSRAHCRVGTPP